MNRLVSSLVFCVLAGASFATVQTKTFEYTHDGEVCEGYVAWDDAVVGARPGVMIVHDWNGLDDYEKLRARMLAELGYVGFAADIYGKATRPKNQEENRAATQRFLSNPSLYRGRLAASVAAMRTIEQVDDSKVAAIGYCFGGTGVMELARSGSDVNGVVSFHGNMGTQMPAKAGEVKAKMMVCHASQDPSVPHAAFVKWLEEMRDAKVDYQLVAFNLAVHPFTVIGGPSYDEKADKRSWEAMKDFFGEIFR